MRTLRQPAIAMLIFTVIVAVGAAFILRALTRPATSEQNGYTAVFTNASGLRVGDDVRVRGVQVGKVGAVRLDARDGGRATVARVDFSVNRDQHLTTGSTLTIKFQNLTGLRYLDLTAGTGPGTPLPPGGTLGTDRTVPSFDITTIFNGLQPVLAAMQPEQINHIISVAVSRGRVIIAAQHVDGMPLIEAVSL